VTGFGGEHTSGSGRSLRHFGQRLASTRWRTALKEKCGNARFFPYSDLPELKYDEHAHGIEKLMANFKQKMN
jgi:hypothetical protein